MLAVRPITLNSGIVMVQNRKLFMLCAALGAVKAQGMSPNNSGAVIAQNDSDLFRRISYQPSTAKPVEIWGSTRRDA